MISKAGFTRTLQFLTMFRDGLICTVSLSVLTVFFGFILALFLAILRLTVDTMATLGTEFQEGSFLWLVNSVYFQYYSVLILAVCIVSMIVVSFLTRTPDYEKLQGLTFGTTSSEERAESRSSWSWGDVVASVLIILGILGSYIFFSG